MHFIVGFLGGILEIDIEVSNFVQTVVVTKNVWETYISLLKVYAKFSHYKCFCFSMDTECPK